MHKSHWKMYILDMKIKHHEFSLHIGDVTLKWRFSTQNSRDENFEITFTLNRISKAP